MLQLLLERGQSYANIASVLGGSEEDVRRRARTTLAELSGSDPDAEVGLTDYLLGQADPIGRADAVRHLQSDPEALASAEELSAKLRLLAPDAKLPELPQPKKRRRPGASVAAPRDAAGAEGVDELEAGGGPSPLSSFSRRQSRIVAAIAAGAVILLFVILAIAGVFDGGDDSVTGAEDAAQVSEEGTIDETITTVNLKPAGKSDASGEAKFGIANQTQPFLDLRLGGLEQPPQDQTYVIWFLLEENRGYPLAPLTTVSESGSVDDRFAIPQAALPVAVRTREIAIALVDNRALATDIEDALQGQEVLLDFSGKTVLSGTIPRLEEPPATEDLEVPGAEGAGALPEGAAPEVAPEAALPPGTETPAP